MKAIVHRRYGSPDLLELEDVEKPAVTADRVLIRVRAVSVNRSDWEALTARPVYVRLGGSGFLRPKRLFLGSDVAGEVEQVGEDVTQFQPGDQVFGDMLWHAPSAFAEYLSVPEKAPLVAKPSGITYEEAAAIPQAGGLALQGLTERGQVEPGDRVLINGAGGGAGTFAVQLAKRFGAEVTAVDNTEKLDLMRSLGADDVVDYTRDDFTKAGRKYDRILDFAAHRSMFAYKRILRPEGSYVMVGGSMPRVLQAVTVGSLISRTTSSTMRLMMAKPNREDLARLAGLVESSEITAVIDKRYQLSEVPAALRRLGEERALGKLVVTI